jgi:hypothetical protein
MSSLAGAARLIGALSKNGIADQLSRLNTLRKKLLQASADSPKPSTPPPPRIGEVSKAIVRVLADGREPLHVAEIHRTIERLLNRPVNYRSVKSCLSEGASRHQPRFERVSYGQYQLAASTRLDSANRRLDRRRQT